MTFAYADSTAVLGPLSPSPEPGAYDLCPRHAERTSVPQGWQVLKLPLDGEPTLPEPASDDLMALADAVRRAGFGVAEPEPLMPPIARRKGHLAVLADPEGADR